MAIKIIGTLYSMFPQVQICTYFDHNRNMNGKWAEACALIILVSSKNCYVCVITEETDLASQTLSSLRK